MFSCFRFGTTFCASLLTASWVLMGHAQEVRTAADSVYTAAQAGRGEAIYAQRCAACHGATLGGGQAPPLAGAEFTRVWAGALSELTDKIRDTMPANDPGTLTRQQAVDIVAHMLRIGAFPSGRTELSANNDVLKQIALAPRTTTPSTASSTTATFPPSLRPMGNLAQVMRGILFPSSNLLFNVQSRDPAAPPPQQPNQSSSGAFPWADWGAGIYTGWELVDYAAVSLTDSAPLMLASGRRCENGRPVPVDDAEWIKFTIELADAGRAAYKASQTRKQDVVADVTEIVAAACTHCHEVYRDKPAPAITNQPDPSNKAARCVR